jgi:hypothetical protein
MPVLSLSGQMIVAFRANVAGKYYANRLTLVVRFVPCIGFLKKITSFLVSLLDVCPEPGLANGRFSRESSTRKTAFSHFFLLIVLSCHPATNCCGCLLLCEMVGCSPAQPFKHRRACDVSKFHHRMSSSSLIIIIIIIIIIITIIII